MRTTTELLAAHDEYVAGLLDRSGSPWPSRRSGIGGAERADRSTRTIGPFDLFGAGEELWAEPGLSSTPSCEDVLAVVSDGAWSVAGCDPYLEWVSERYPGLHEVVETAVAAIQEVRWFVHLGDGGEETSFLHAVDELSFRPALTPPAISIARAGPEDDLVLFAKVLELSEMYGPRSAVRDVGVRALPGMRGDMAPLLRSALEGDEVTFFFAKAGDQVAAVGFHLPVGSSSELRVGCVPESRGRGIGSAVISALVRDAFASGVANVFTASVDPDVGRRLGFIRVCELVGCEFRHMGDLTNEERDSLLGR